MNDIDYFHEEIKRIAADLTVSQKELRRRGVLKEMKSSEYRYERTGHHQPLSLDWMPSIGLWGHTPAKLIAAAVDKTEAAVTTYANYHGIRVRFPPGRTQWDVAIEAYTEMFMYEYKDLVMAAEAKTVRLHPVEVLIYFVGVSRIVDKRTDMDPDPTIAELQAYLRPMRAEWEPYSRCIDDVFRYTGSQ